jgi:hypothetical protein
MAREYRSFADFERDEIRPGMRIGWSVDELEEPSGHADDFDADPIEELWDLAADDDDE